MDLSVLAQYSKVLLLQGPVGPFFKELKEYLINRKTEVAQVVFNYADEKFSDGINVIPYKGKAEDYMSWLGLLHTQLYKATAVVLFGDCRAFHKLSVDFFKAQGVDIFVFEEGYLRPTWITLDLGGTNSRSNYKPQLESLLTLSKEEKKYSISLLELETNSSFEKSKNYSLFFWKTISYYYLLKYAFYLNFGKSKYPYYEHHRNLNFSYLLKISLNWSIHKVKNFLFFANLYSKLFSIINPKNYFLVALQVFNDFQVKDGSSYPSSGEFLEDILNKYADLNVPEKLIIKQHPFDVGLFNYKKIVKKVCKERNIAKSKITFITEGHLPSLIKNSKGLITINSTVGLSALQHNIPTICLGSSIYTCKGVTYEPGDLNLFLSSKKLEEPSSLDVKLITLAIAYWTQIPGSFYKGITVPRGSPDPLMEPNSFYTDKI